MTGHVDGPHLVTALEPMLLRGDRADGPHDGSAGNFIGRGLVSRQLGLLRQLGRLLVAGRHGDGQQGDDDQAGELPHRVPPV